MRSQGRRKLGPSIGIFSEPGSGERHSLWRGEWDPMVGRGKCRAILSKSSVAPLDVLMHVENNLTANLLHSFSFLFRTFRPASAAHLPDPSFCTLSDEKRAGPSLVAAAAHLTLVSLSPLREPPARARHRSHLIEYIIWIFELYDVRKGRSGADAYAEQEARGPTGDRRAAR